MDDALILFPELVIQYQAGSIRGTRVGPIDTLLACAMEEKLIHVAGTALGDQDQYELGLPAIQEQVCVGQKNGWIGFTVAMPYKRPSSVWVHTTAVDDRVTSFFLDRYHAPLCLTVGWSRRLNGLCIEKIDVRGTD